MSPTLSFSLAGRDLARSYGAMTVLDGVDLTVGPRSRVGVVGPNGTGKTTLLRLLGGLESPDRGVVVRTPADLRVAYLPQEHLCTGDETLLDFLGRRSGVSSAEAELAHAAAALASDHAGRDGRYTRALDDYLALGGPDFDSRVRVTCADLGLPERLLTAPMATLSGGEASRASLAAVLVSRFDVFLLDEPTNNLDFAGLARLERFVDELEGGVVVVSHDRAFLERIVDRVVEIDEHTRRSTAYGGGWTGYLEARAVARRHAEETYDAYRSERARLEQRARTQRQWAVQGVRRERRTSDNDKQQRDFRINASERQAAKVRASEHALGRLEVVEKPWEGWDLRFTVSEAPTSGDVVLRLVGALVERPGPPSSWRRRHETVALRRQNGFSLGPVDLEIRRGERVAIVGPNGSGKSTLLGALLGTVPLAGGERSIGPSVVVGEMDQARRTLSDGRPLLAAFVAATGMDQGEARTLLAKFGLGADHVLRPTETLSPGERTRAVLARFAAQGVNCLVLDEPTNHLDLPAIEQLETALDSYEGTLLLVSHDRALLDAVRITRAVDARGAPADDWRR